jgi:hypothetical protein
MKNIIHHFLLVKFSINLKAGLASCSLFRVSLNFYLYVAYGVFTPYPESARLEECVLPRSRDWAQVRPEWDLAENAAFIVGGFSLRG